MDEVEQFLKQYEEKKLAQDKPNPVLQTCLDCIEKLSGIYDILGASAAVIEGLDRETRRMEHSILILIMLLVLLHHRNVPAEPITHLFL